MKKTKLFAVKNPKGQFIGNSVCDTKIGAIFSADWEDDEIWRVSRNGCMNNEAVRKRVKRAGYRIVPVKIVEIKG